MNHLSGALLVSSSVILVFVCLFVFIVGFGRHCERHCSLTAVRWRRGGGGGGGGGGDGGKGVLYRL